MLLCLFSVLVSEKFLVAAFSQSLVSDFTFTLPAGRKECFFQTMKKDASLEIEYQVPGVYMIGFTWGKGEHIIVNEHT